MLKNILSTTLLLLFVLTAYAQSNTGSSGGEASGAGGKASYTVGQTASSTLNGTGGTMTQGVQQPYEIFVLTGMKEAGIKLNALIYPNPAASHVVLVIDKKDLSGMTCVLSDVQGKLLSTQKIKDTQTKIDLSALAAGSYQIQVLYNNQEIKLFKVIKN